MALILYDPDIIVDYIPEDQRGSDNPTIIHLKFVPFSKVQHYARMIAARTKGITNPEKITEKNQGVQRKQFIDSVDSVSNCTLPDGTVITNAEQFYDLASTDLIYEVIKAMESDTKLSEGQVKNSEPLSVSNEPKAASSTVTPAPTPTESKETAPTVTVLKQV